MLKQAIPRSRHISENERNGIIAANGTCTACKVPGRNLGPGIAPTCSLALLPKAHKRTASLACLREGEASVGLHGLHSARPFCCRRDIKGLEVSSLESYVQLATKSTVITCPKDGNSGSVQICLRRFISKARAADTQEGGRRLSI